MRILHLNNIIDPLNWEKFKIISFEEKEWHVFSWELISKDNNYPIINWIPRLLTWEFKKDLLKANIDFLNKFKNELSEKFKNEWNDLISWIKDLNTFIKHQKKTSESFSFEWNKIYKENDFEMENFIHFLWWIKNKDDFQNKIILDVWCGSWRFSKWAALFWSKIVYWMDLSWAVEIAFNMTKNQKNVCIMQWDIYNPPFKNSIDFAYSIWVLHHLPNPKEWFLSISNKTLKKWGDFLIWLYSKKNNLRALYFYEPIRVITNKMNKKLLLIICHIPAIFVHLLNYLTIFFNKIWFTKLAKKIPFSYYSYFPYNMKLNDSFDVLATPKSNYYNIEDIIPWYEEWGFLNVKWKYLDEAWLTLNWIKK